MILDTSAIIAILKDEPERDAFIAALVDADAVLLSAASYLEAVIVLKNKQMDALLLLTQFMQRFPLTIVDVTAAQGHIAADAFLRYGKGQGAKAQLNFGDCLVYALAKSTAEPLLFKGDDFAHTDVARVI